MPSKAWQTELGDKELGGTPAFEQTILDTVVSALRDPGDQVPRNSTDMSYNKSFYVSAVFNFIRCNAMFKVFRAKLLS